MRFSGSERDDEGPWFTLGKLEVTTTTFIVLVWSVTVLVFAAEPIDKPVMTAIALIPDKVGLGEVWRLITWPASHSSFGLWDLIGAAIFWMFGTDLERQVGRRPFARLMGWSILIIGLVGTIFGLLLSNEGEIAGLGLLSVVVIGLYIAEHPMRPFFFGIPAWVVGAVFAALELVNDLAYRDWLRLITILASAGLIALVARRVDLLTMYDKIPLVRLPGRKGRRGRSAAGSGPTPITGQRGPDSGAGRRAPRRAKRTSGEPAEVIPMPQTRRRPAPTVVPDMSADDLALDLLLDKISAGGMEALDDNERKALDELRARRRKT